MPSKINGFDARPVEVGGKKAAERTAGKSAAAPGAAVSAAAHVKLTGPAVQLAALEKAIAQVPDVDMDRVDAIRTEIESGEYTIDSRKIASKLLELERAIASVEADKQG